MLALRMTDSGPRVEETPRPSRTNEALVRVTLSGICNTDLEITRGYAAFRGTLGHEFVGVAETAPGRPDLIGRRVVGEINAGCGACPDCRAGDSRHCPTRTVLGIVGRDGAHATHLELPVANLLVVPDAVTDAEAVFVEPLAAAFGVIERLGSPPRGLKVAVIGDGKLGLLCAQVLALSGARVTAIGRHPAKLRLLSAKGIETLLEGDAAKLAREFDVVVEASGGESGFRRAIGLTKPRGTVVLKSTFHGAPTWDAASVVVDEISVIGSRCGRFAPALEALRRKEIDATSMIEAEAPLSEGVRALERAAVRGALKILLRP